MEKVTHKSLKILSCLVAALSPTIEWFTEHIVQSWRALLLISLVTGAGYTYVYARGDMHRSTYIFNMIWLAFLVMYEAWRVYQEWKRK